MCGTIGGIWCETRGVREESRECRVDMRESETSRPDVEHVYCGEGCGTIGGVWRRKARSCTTTTTKGVFTGV